jgi:hypothetical protein
MVFARYCSCLVCRFRHWSLHPGFRLRLPKHITVYPLRFSETLQKRCTSGGSVDQTWWRSMNEWSTTFWGEGVVCAGIPAGGGAKVKLGRQLKCTNSREDIYIRMRDICSIELVGYIQYVCLCVHVYVCMLVCSCRFSSSEEKLGPSLRSSGQSSWLQIQRSGFYSWQCQIFWEIVDLEWGPFSLVSTIERLLGRQSSGSGLECREYGRRDPSRWPHGTLYSQKMALTSPTNGCRSVGIIRSRTQATKFSF